MDRDKNARQTEKERMKEISFEEIYKIFLEKKKNFFLQNHSFEKNLFFQNFLNLDILLKKQFPFLFCQMFFSFNISLFFSLSLFFFNRKYPTIFHLPHPHRLNSESQLRSELILNFCKLSVSMAGLSGLSASSETAVAIG